MRNRWRFAGVHVALAVVLVLLVDLHHGTASGSSVGSSFAIIGKRMFASVVMPFLAGLITRAIFGRTDDRPAPGFGLRYTALSVVALMLVWIISGLAGAYAPTSDARFMLPIQAFMYITPVLIVFAALLSLRRWKVLPPQPS